MLCFWTVVLEKTLESPLDCKEIQPVHPKGNQSWIFIGRADAESLTPIFCPSDGKNWLLWKDTDAGKDWRQEEKGTTEDEMVGWHHRLDEHGFGRTLGVDDGQGGLACCSSWGRKESDTTKQLNWTELNPGSIPEILMNPSRLKGRKEEGERGRERRRRREGGKEERNKSTNHGFVGQNTKAKGMF